MRTRNPQPRRVSNRSVPTPTEAVVLREVEIAGSEYIEQEGSFRQSTDYDGTDVESADASSGWRVESEGAAEFQEVRVRGPVSASDLELAGQNAVVSGGEFTTGTEGWSATNGTLSTTTLDPYDTNTHSLVVTATAAGVSVMSDEIEIPTVDRPYVLRGYVNNDDGLYLDFQYQWLDASLAVVGGPNLISGVKMAPGWNQFEVSTGFPPAGTAYLQWGVKDTLGGATAGEEFRISNWTVYQLSLATGAWFYTQPRSVIATQTRVTDGAVYLRPNISAASTGLDATAGLGGMLASTSRYTNGAVAPLTLVRSPSFHPTNNAEIYLFGGTDDGTTSTETEIHLRADIIVLDNNRRWWPPYTCQVERTSVFGTTSGVGAMLSWTSEVYDPDGMRPTGQFYVMLPGTPSDSWLVSTSIHVEFQGSAAGRRLVGASWNATTTAGLDRPITELDPNTASSCVLEHHHTDIRVGTDYVQTWVYQDSGGPLNVQRAQMVVSAIPLP